MQSTTNAFLDGITTDLHPLNMPETALTSALNATVFTGNGNEGLLQNDMGNTLIKDSITGSIMALNDGFIPLGMKEHGGILYIASYNPETGEGELGSIPSPIIHYTLNGLVSDSRVTDPTKISDLGEDEPESEFVNITKVSVNERLNTNTLYVLSDYIFNGGDKFIVSLDLDQEREATPNDEDEFPLKTTKRIDGVYPQITEFVTNDNWDSWSVQKGWVRIELYAVTSTGKEMHLGGLDSVPQQYYDTDGRPQYSNHWFLNNVAIDEVRTRTTDMFKTYPNIPAGRLAIKFVVEYPSNLEFTYNKSYDANLPQVYIHGSLDNSKKYVIVPGFVYSADCPIRPDLIKITCNNGTIPVYTFSTDLASIYTAFPDQPTKKLQLGSIIVTEATQPDRTKGIFSQAPYDGQEDGSVAFPYSNRYINTGGSNRAGDNIAISMKRDSNTTQFVISKFLSGNTYLPDENPVSNYTSLDHDGLFYVELDDYDIDLEFTIELYTRALNLPDDAVTFADYNYVLYNTQTLPIFNPATIYLKGFDNTDVTLDGVSQYFDFKDGQFDIQLFKGLSADAQDCFLYDDGDSYGYSASDKIILSYGTEDKYIPFANNGQDHFTFDQFKNFQTWIAPQYVTYIDDDGCPAFDNKTGPSYRPAYLWSAIPHGYNNFGNLADYDNSASYYYNKSKNKDSNSNPKIWLKTSKARENGWEWFIISSVVPQVKFYETTGLNPRFVNFLMPITKKKSTGDNWEDEILEDAANLRNYFKNLKNIAGFNYLDLKKHCLCKTNLRITYQLFSSAYNDSTTNLLNGGEEGKKFAELSGYEYFPKMGELCCLYHGNGGNQWDTEDLFDTTNPQGLVHNALTKRKKNSTNTGIPTGRACFETYAFKATSGARNADLGNLMIDHYRGIHDYYFATTNNAHFSDLDLYERPGNSYVGIMHCGLTNWGIDSSNGAVNKDVKTRRYCIGFITEAMKHCPQWASAGINTYGGEEHDGKTTLILSLLLLNYKNGLDYLYYKPEIGEQKENTTKIIFKDCGTGLAWPQFPIIHIRDNKTMIGDLESWHTTLQSYSNVKLTVNQKFYVNGAETETRTYTNKATGSNNPNIGISTSDNKPIIGMCPDLDSDTLTIYIPYKSKTYKITTDVNIQYELGARSDNKIDGLYDTTYEKNPIIKVANDNLLAVASPQLFIDKSQSDLTKNYLADYNIVPIIQIGDGSVGLWKLNGSYMLVPHNINTTSGFETFDLTEIFSGVTLVNPNDKSSGKNSFVNDARYLYIDSTQELTVTQPAVSNCNNITDKLCVFSLTYNDSTTAKIDITINGKTYRLNGKEDDVNKSHDHEHFIPFYRGDRITKIQLKVSSASVPCWIRGCGIFPVNVDLNADAAEITELWNQNIVKFFKDNQTEEQKGQLYFVTDPEVTQNIIFPAVACFKETIYTDARQIDNMKKS